MLIQATKQGRIFMVNYLLDSKRVDINEKDEKGQTALINACLLHDNMAVTRRKLLRLLLSRNAEVNICDNTGRNALMWACYLARIDVVKILFGRSFMDLDFTCTDNHGNSALHYVSSTGQHTLTTMMVKTMKRFRVCLDVRNNEGLTAVIAATKNGHDSCAVVLLQHGASPNIVDPQTSMNVNELAKKTNMKSLLVHISLRNPTIQSRCLFPRQRDDDDDVRAAMRSRESSWKTKTSSGVPVNCSVVPVNCSGVPVNCLDVPVNCSSVPVNCSAYPDFGTNKSRRVLVRKRQDDSKEHSDEHSHSIDGLKRIVRDHNSLVVQSDDSSHGPSSQLSANPYSPHGRPSRPSGRYADISFNMRDLSSVLSLYSEQQASNFRKGFLTPVMTTEEFRTHLEAMKLKPHSRPKRRSSSTRSSTSTMTSTLGYSPLIQHRRRSVLLRDNDRRRSDTSHTFPRRSSLNPTASNISWRRETPFTRNLSHPLIDLNLLQKTGE